MGSKKTATLFCWTFLIFVQETNSITIGILQNLTYQANQTSSVVINGTCRECVCQSFVFGIPFIAVAFNCYVNENKCELYGNYSSNYELLENSNSSFYFYPSLPPLKIATGMFLIILNVYNV